MLSVMDDEKDHASPHVHFDTELSFLSPIKSGETPAHGKHAAQHGIRTPNFFSPIASMTSPITAQATPKLTPILKKPAEERRPSSVAKRLQFNTQQEKQTPKKVSHSIDAGKKSPTMATQTSFDKKQVQQDTLAGKPCPYCHSSSASHQIPPQQPTATMYTTTQTPNRYQYFSDYEYTSTPTFRALLSPPLPALSTRSNNYISTSYKRPLSPMNYEYWRSRYNAQLEFIESQRRIFRYKL